MRSGEEQQLLGYVGMCCCGIGILLCVILLPLSFRALAEEELAFPKSSVSSKIDFSEIYCCGHYHVGPTMRFAKVNRHVHTVFISESNAWTCPTENGTCKDLAGTANEVGQTVYTSFAVNFRIIRDRESAKLAYEKYQFSDDRVRQAVSALALENSKETPQQHSVEEIYGAFTDEEPQILINTNLLNIDMNVFGYELQDVIVTEIKMPAAAQAKFLVQEIRRYQDDIIRNSWIANETRLETAAIVNEINIEGISAVRAIAAQADATVARLEADLEAYRREIDISATTYLIEMYKQVFTNSTDMEIAEMATTSMYMDQVMQTGSSDGVTALFMDQSSNRIFTEELSR